MTTNQHDASFTPGPWTVQVDDTGGIFSGWPSVQASPEIDAAIVHRAGFRQEHWGELSLRETTANAHLIAAAPDLYAALREFSTAWRVGLDTPEEDAAMQGRVNAALAKAEGRTP